MEYAIQIIIALRDLHDEDLVYGDLNPRFISMDEYGYLNLSDLILDKEIQRRKKEENSQLETLPYMAPEKVFNKFKFEGMTGVEGDWYGLGVLL